jgi:hypothetical protein
MSKRKSFTFGAFCKKVVLGTKSTAKKANQAVKDSKAQFVEGYKSVTEPKE